MTHFPIVSAALIGIFVPVAATAVEVTLFPLSPPVEQSNGGTASVGSSIPNLGEIVSLEEFLATGTELVDVQNADTASGNGGAAGAFRAFDLLFSNPADAEDVVFDLELAWTLAAALSDPGGQASGFAETSAELAVFDAEDVLDPNRSSTPLGGAFVEVMAAGASVAEMDGETLTFVLAPGESIGVSLLGNSSSLSNGGGLVATSSTSFSLTVTDIRRPDDPEVIPLPAGLPLLAGGLLSFVALQRRRK